MLTLQVAVKNIYSNSDGYQQLVQFYDTAKAYRDQSISLDFSQITWFDANMSAVLAGMVYKLSQENGLKFYTDGKIIQQKFEVLIRNGFISYGDSPVKDTRKSTLPIRSFAKSDKNGFIEYIDKNLMQHRGMPSLTALQREQIKDDLVELLSNIDYHANTDYPFFVCGQYYPYNSHLVFTMVDLGDGFLPKISQTTGGQVADAQGAILWALRGNTTKPVYERVPGGLGIRNIHNYCKENGGKLHIATGNAFWHSDKACAGSDGCYLLPSSFVGSSINLFFKHG